MINMPASCNQKHKIYENLLPLKSAKAGGPNMPISAPNAYIDCIVALIYFC